jgi:hypothetical protein
VYELVNLTLPTVVRSIEEVLEDYPEHPYQSAFSVYPLRQKLIAHILSSIPNRYAIEGELPPVGTLKSPHRSPLSERLHLETIVRGSILHLLRENADWLSQHIPAADDVDKLS